MRPCDFVFPSRNEIAAIETCGQRQITTNKKVFYSVFSQKWFGLRRNSGVSIKAVKLLSLVMVIYCLKLKSWVHSLDTARNNYMHVLHSKMQPNRFHSFLMSCEKLPSQKKTRTLERISVQTLDETVDAQPLPVGACTTSAPQPEKATRFTGQAPTPQLSAI